MFLVQGVHPIDVLSRDRAFLRRIALLGLGAYVTRRVFLDPTGTGVFFRFTSAFLPVQFGQVTNTGIVLAPSIREGTTHRTRCAWATCHAGE